MTCFGQMYRFLKQILTYFGGIDAENIKTPVLNNRPVDLESVFDNRGNVVVKIIMLKRVCVVVIFDLQVQGIRHSRNTAF